MRKLLQVVLALVTVIGGFGGAVVVPTMLVTQGCASVRPPETLSPVGDAAFYARRVILAIDQIQTLAIDGEKSGAISEADARTIVTATGEAAKAGASLAATLRAGTGDASAKKRWAAAIRKALDEVVQKLSPNTQTLVEPYVRTTLTLLTVFSEF